MITSSSAVPCAPPPLAASPRRPRWCPPCTQRPDASTQSQVAEVAPIPPHGVRTLRWPRYLHTESGAEVAPISPHGVRTLRWPRYLHTEPGAEVAPISPHGVRTLRWPRYLHSPHRVRSSGAPDTSTESGASESSSDSTTVCTEQVSPSSPYLTPRPGNGAWHGMAWHDGATTTAWQRISRCGIRVSTKY